MFFVLSSPYKMVVVLRLNCQTNKQSTFKYLQDTIVIMVCSLQAVE